MFSFSLFFQSNRADVDRQNASKLKNLATVVGPMTFLAMNI